MLGSKKTSQAPKRPKKSSMNKHKEDPGKLRIEVALMDSVKYLVLLLLSFEGGMNLKKHWYLKDHYCFRML